MQQPDMFSQAQGHISRSLVTCNAYDIIWTNCLLFESFETAFNS